MGEFKTSLRLSPATSRKEWLKQRRSAKKSGATIIVGGSGYAIPTEAVSGAGYGGAGSEALARLNDMFERVNIGTDEEPVYAIRAKYGFFSDSFVSAGGMNTTE